MNDIKKLLAFGDILFDIYTDASYRFIGSIQPYVTNVSSSLPRNFANHFCRKKRLISDAFCIHCVGIGAIGLALCFSYTR